MDNTPTDLGHSAFIMIESGKQARKFAREINAGNIDINDRYYSGCHKYVAFARFSNKRNGGV